jgi:hypothetical protein
LLFALLLSLGGPTLPLVACGGGDANASGPDDAQAAPGDGTIADAASSSDGSSRPLDAPAGDGDDAAGDGGSSTDAGADVGLDTGGDASGEPGDAGDSGDASAVAPALRAVHVAEDLAGGVPFTACAAPHAGGAPIAVATLSYRSISAYVPVPAGSYDVWAVVSGGGCTPDAGTIATVRTFDVTGPTTLAFYTTGILPGDDIAAFPEHGSPSGQADARMHDVIPIGTFDFRAETSPTMRTSLGSGLSFGQAGALTQLAPSSGSWFFDLLPAGSMTPDVGATVTLTPGVWDGFAFPRRSSSSGEGLVVCPPNASSMAVACVAGL